MKKVLTAIGAVLCFTGIASLAIFFVLSPQGYTQSRMGLTANIAAVTSGDAAPADAANPTVATPAATSQGSVAAPGESTAQISAADAIFENANQNRPATIEESLPASDTSSTTPTAPSEATPVVTRPAASDLPEATATITVTPTVPEFVPSAQPTVRATNESSVPLPFDESVFTNDDRWITVWGVADKTQSGRLHLSASANSVGGATYLKGADAWTNYVMRASIDWTGGKTFGLMANYVDASNYVLCEYVKTDAYVATMQLIQYDGGNRILRTAATPVSLSGDGTGLTATIGVNGVYGTCSLSGQTVSNQGIGAGKSAFSTSRGGGIGFTVNDPIPGAAQIIVTHVDVAGT